MTLESKRADLVADFAPIDDVHERLTLLVDRARTVPPLPAEARLDGNRVRGCVSVVWLTGELAGGRCLFRADAESPLVRGLVVAVADFFSGAPPAEVAASELDPLAALGLLENLSPTRRNGLAATRAAIRAWARQHAALPPAAPA